ncbi:cytochrome P450 [Aspergillus saccharolyticus JOP 1030-1]|uniref:Cytochrome P450 n=1 Tax=Aspergillus saccharolyticus JOP 1030-1 TaxID=1450539 RepID=A0A318ZEH8_9EURO|nr:cytochrome P450 [Aspergillus saccharolyticus JOP 1030-1]PYH45067.1 cytochrome P450 [Aspergillus saccharolyticus JOP 1030-1]
MDPLQVSICIIATVLGTTSHLGLFIQSEWDVHAFPLFATLYLWPTVMLGLLAGAGYYHAMWLALSALASFNIALGLSIAVYRYFFHALRRFPGPRLARLSALWSIKAAVIDAKWHLRVQELHRQYGTFVRIKPREISINNPAAIKVIHGAGTSCVKGTFYDLNYPNHSLQMTRDKAHHARRRKIWDRGFSPRALAGYEPFLLDHCKVLVELISSRASHRQEVNKLIDGFTWDSMGVLTLGKSFNMLQGAPPSEIKQMKALGRLASVLQCASWIGQLIRSAPLLRYKTQQWLDWCGEQLEKRKQMELDHKDLFSYLIEGSLANSGPGQAKSSMDEDLVYDSELAITAGSDTSAATVSALLYLLAQHPDKLRELQQELDTCLPAKEGLSHAVLAGKPWLESCINEGLRLYPSVSSGVPRETGSEGLMIAGVHIPPRTTVSTPTYTIHRDPRNFVDPNSFIPERWTSKPEMVLCKEAFKSFSTGKYACAGKPFAMMEMRLLVATIGRDRDHWRQ